MTKTGEDEETTQLWLGEYKHVLSIGDCCRIGYWIIDYVHTLVNKAAATH